VYTLAPIDESLNRAFLLAHFIIGNKQNAIRVVSQAMAKLEVTASAQGKRLYYKAAGRSGGSLRFRNKVTFSELHLLQRLVYIESEPYERKKEQKSGGALVRTEDMIIHFIKHLARITSRRNSFYVTLGISRLLYNYTTPETMAIYNMVVQDPERVKDDYYYRSRKGVLLREMKTRFGELIRVGHLQRGEERFESDSNPSRFVHLVRECLTFFTPWVTNCSVPATVNPIASGIPALSSSIDISEHEIELNRIHAVLHPDCYGRVTEALGLQTPERRLEVPLFYIANEDKTGGDAVRTPIADLDEEDLTTIKSDLNDLAKRRKKASTGFLRVLVDGANYAQLDLKKASHMRFNVDNEKELLEIWSTDKTGDLLLASHFFSLAHHDQPELTESSIVLEGGQKLSINIQPLNDGSGLTVDVNYRETNPVNATSLAVRRIFAGSALKRSPGNRGLVREDLSKMLIPVSAVILLLAITTGVVTYLQRGRNAVDSRSGANMDESRSATKGVADTADHRNPPLNESLVAQRRGSPNVEKSSPNPDTTRQSSPVGAGTEANSRPEEVTRAITREDPSLKLSDVKSVFVESSGTEPASESLRDVLAEKLQVSNRFTLSKVRDDADAVLRVTLRRPAVVNAVGSPPPVFAVQLINAKGQIIWPPRHTSTRTFSAPELEQVAAQIVRDLLADTNPRRR
jgi:hypothetical protein